MASLILHTAFRMHTRALGQVIGDNFEDSHRAIRIQCIGTHYNGMYPNWSSIPLNTQGQMFNEFKVYTNISGNIVVLYLLRVKTDHLHKKKTRIFENRVLVNRLEVDLLSRKRIRRRSLGIVVHHPQALMVRIERQYLQWRKREEREKKREEEIATAKDVENKRYAVLQAQLTFLFESGNILPPCPASSDGSDQEGDENDKSDKESEGDEE
ncbi:hypothetical protein H5410_064395 [Solanum commersonii]|uniref:Uncharacterized protein n=1 Tax=Solanum commersonii TaxID=4109 RepID=A0A9J5VZN1_SOLCO|nr:hypothetical protein H5410_064395 [Solanum commersonii]